MDSYETYFALREAGISLVLSENRDRLHCEPAEDLTPDLAEAVADNHDFLLKKELLRELIRFVSGRIAAREVTASRHLYSIPAAATVFESMSGDSKRISDALENQAVDDFKDTMRQWAKSALALYEKVREEDNGDERSSPEQESKEPDEPNEPAQQSLLA